MFVLVYALFIFAAVIGWFINLFSIFGLVADGVTAELIIRIAGVPLFPVGAIAGLFL